MSIKFIKFKFINENNIINITYIEILFLSIFGFDRRYAHQVATMQNIINVNQF